MGIGPTLATRFGPATYSNLRGRSSLPKTLPGNICARREVFAAKKNAAKNSPGTCGMLAGPLYTCIASVMGGSSSCDWQGYGHDYGQACPMGATDSIQSSRITMAARSWYCSERSSCSQRAHTPTELPEPGCLLDSQGNSSKYTSNSHTTHPLSPFPTRQLVDYLVALTCRFTSFLKRAEGRGALPRRQVPKASRSANSEGFTHLHRLALAAARALKQWT